MNKPKKKSLSKQIEKSFDTRDENVLDYVDAAISEFLRIKAPEPISLMTKEGARKALEDTTRLSKELDKQLKTVRTLKRLLNDSKD